MPDLDEKLITTKLLTHTPASDKLGLGNQQDEK